MPGATSTRAGTSWSSLPRPTSPPTPCRRLPHSGARTARTGRLCGRPSRRSSSDSDATTRAPCRGVMWARCARPAVRRHPCTTRGSARSPLRHGPTAWSGSATTRSSCGGMGAPWTCSNASRACRGRGASSGPPAPSGRPRGVASKPSSGRSYFRRFRPGRRFPPKRSRSRFPSPPLVPKAGRAPGERFSHPSRRAPGMLSFCMLSFNAKLQQPQDDASTSVGARVPPTSVGG